MGERCGKQGALSGRGGGVDLETALVDRGWTEAVGPSGAGVVAAVTSQRKGRDNGSDRQQLSTRERPTQPRKACTDRAVDDGQRAGAEAATGAWRQ
jgi:hypothetical protein